MVKIIVLVGLLALSFCVAMAADHSPLQDFCVAQSNSQCINMFDVFVSPTSNNIRLRYNLASRKQRFFTYPSHRAPDSWGFLDARGLLEILVSPTMLLNGLTCKNPSMVQAREFSFSELHISGNTSNAVGSRVTLVATSQIQGLNTLGISLARIDYAPWGINPPHTHTHATDIFTVIEGSLEVGFVISNPDNRLISKILNKGDVFVFPIGLVHYQRNVGNGNTMAIASLSSQNPGVITIANAVFGSKPDISTDILVKALQVDKSVISNAQSKF